MLSKMARPLLSVLAWAAVAASAPAAYAAKPDPAVGTACEVQTFETSRFTVCRYRRDEDELRLEWHGPAGPLGGFSALAQTLGPSAARVRFAMNGGMYDPAQTPVGLLVREGRVEHPADSSQGRGNFYLLPNGVFWIDRRGAAHVDETQRFLAEAHNPAWATQSGPLLLSSGRQHPAIAENGASLAIRNGVGVAGAGDAWFVISNDPVSFGRLARLFRDQLHCEDALYLDGAISSLWAPDLGRRDARTGLGPLIVVSAKPR